MAKNNTLTKGLIIEKLPGYFLIACLIAVFAVTIYILRPFITVLFLASILAIAFYGIFNWIKNLFRGWERSASFVTCLLVVIVILLPFTIITLLLASEAFDTYVLIQDKIESGVFDKYLQWSEGGFFFDFIKQIEPFVDLNSIDIKSGIISGAQAVSTFLASQTVSFVQSLSNIFIGVIVLLFAMYYFFKDGPKLVEKLGVLSPLPESYEKELFTKIKSMVRAVVFGVFLTSIIQGILGGIGFAIAGISNPVFWGTIMAFFSLMPVVGTAIIWVPAAIVMLILGNYFGAIFLVIWGAVVIGSADNVLRPYLIGGKAKTYPLMTFLVVLGGVMTMGLKGVILGPLILIVLMSFLHIYEAEYSKLLKR